MAEDISRKSSTGAGQNHNSAEVDQDAWHARRSPHPESEPPRAREAALASRAQEVLVELLLRGLERELDREPKVKSPPKPKRRKDDEEPQGKSKQGDDSGREGEPRDEEDEGSKQDDKDDKDEGSGGGAKDEKGEEGGKEEGGAKEKKEPISPQRKRLFIAIAGVAALLLLVGGTLWWLHARQYENTDDAFIDSNQSQIGSQIAGRVQSIDVADNQHVDPGQPLIELDPRDYQVKLEQSRAAAGNSAAQAKQARADYALQQANIGQQEAQVRVAEADLEQARRDQARYQNIDPAAVTKQQLDQAGANVKSDQAKLSAAREAVRGGRAQLESQRAKITAADAQTKESQADVSAAELNLSYTHIVAPTAGRITRRTVNLGNYIQPGQALLAVVPDEMWVTANFKETQLTRMHPGQEVEITVDAYPSQKIKGHVDSVQRGTGAVFSSLPAENATGNYVKVVQRVPVKIVFDGDDWKKLPLAPGMSVSPRVTVR